MGKNHNTDCDVLIAGGGAAGCTMAAMLSQSGIRVVCVDQEPKEKVLNPTFDGRTMAISFGSSEILNHAGLWDSLLPHACPIKTIKVTENGAPSLLDFLSRDSGENAMGWIIEMRNLKRTLYDRLSSIKDCTYLSPARILSYEVNDNFVHTTLEDGRIIRSSIVIGADGRQSFTRAFMNIDTRGWRYNQRAIVCIITHENPHNHTAFEDFRKDGPLAILPMRDDEKGGHRSSIVWTEQGDEKDSVIIWDDETFKTALNEKLPAMYGRVLSLGPRFSYPLSLSHAHTYIGRRMALIADAAHGIHPIAGQGLNLGLRDVDLLSTLLIDAHRSGQDLGSYDLLKAYERGRKPDNMVMAGATDILNKLFSNDLKTARVLRKIGLMAVEKMPTAKQFLMNQAMGKRILK